MACCHVVLAAVLILPRLASAQGAAGIGPAIRQEYFHGLPVTKFMQYGSGAEEEIGRILADPRERRYWSNAIGALGLVGGESAAAIIIGFIERDTPPSDVHEAAARSNGLIALGWLVARTGSPVARNYLLGGLREDSWTSGRRGRWVPYGALTRDETAGHLVKLSLLGLAVSGTREADSALASVALEAPSVASLTQGRTLTAQEGIRINREIRALGLQEYYRRQGL
jgi:hypothetical protein